MIDITDTPPTVPGYSSIFAMLLLTWVLTACASAPSPPSIDSAEAILPVTPLQIREAVEEVLSQDGYDFEVTQHDATAIRTGYRRETISPWDWLLRARFGVGRTQADAQITPLNEASAKLTIHVAHEGKATMWNAWTGASPPVAQRAEQYVRLVKNRLGVL